jgi:SAM-dependent methyltransferase
MPLMDTGTFARLFSAQYAEFAEDLPVWQHLAREAGSPILEIGCGAGRVLRVLARDGFDVTGIDTSPEMLRRAREALPAELRSRVRFVDQDVRSLDLPDRYRLILAPCNTLAGLPDVDLAQALTRSRAHLHPGGSLAFEVPCPSQAEVTTDSSEPLDTFLDPESGNPVQVYAAQQVSPEGVRVEVVWRYDELRPDGIVESWTLPTTFHLRGPEDYGRLLTDAGFADVRFFGNYDLEPLGPDSPQVMIVCHA